MRKCVIEDCENKHLARGWCGKHYKRWRVFGDPLKPPVVERKPPECVVEECSNPVASRGLCSKHWSRWNRHGDPVAPPTKLPGIVNSYAAAHTRVATIRGKATTYSCVQCGSQAHQWAYDGKDPHERTDNTRDGCPWSMDIDRYQPMCRPCHYQVDHNGDVERRPA